MKTIESANVQVIELSLLIIFVAFTILGVVLCFFAHEIESYYASAKITGVGTLSAMFLYWVPSLLENLLKMSRNEALCLLFLIQCFLMIVAGISWSIGSKIFSIKLANEIMVCVGIIGIIFVIFPSLIFEAF